MLDVIGICEKYSATNVDPYPLIFSRGDGVYLYDEKGNSYIDMVAGVAVVSFGYRHPRLMKALVTQADKMAMLTRNFYSEPLALFLKTACELFEMERALPLNSGAEAVEAALKISRKWGYIVKKIPKDKAEIITCDNSFHGRTVTVVSMSSINKYKEHFGPLTPGFISIPFNDAGALEKAITPNTTAFLVEPIQGEGGIIVPDVGYLKRCEEICRKNNVLLIVDEIQTGMGRTGKLLASQHENIKPDGVLLGKALGGGLLPVSLFLAKNNLMEVIHPGEHGTTFGGNSLACFVAYEAINTLLDEKLSENAAKLGEYFLAKLKEIKTPAIVEVRGRGLLIAIEVNTHIVQSRTVFEKLAERGLLGLETRNKIIRLLPPLIITKQQIDDAIEIVRDVFDNLLHK